jgi:hypothetical protein
MNPFPCQSLDDYLAHDLIGDELVQFTAHLSSCVDCQQAVREQQRLDGLLSEAVIRLDLVPFGLTDRVRRQLRASRVRKLAALAAGLAAAMTAIWLVGHFLPRRDLPQSPGRSRGRTASSRCAAIRRPGSSDFLRERRCNGHSRKPRFSERHRHPGLSWSAQSASISADRGGFASHPRKE